VKEIDALAFERERHRDLFSDRVVPGRRGERPEIPPKRRQPVPVLDPAEKDEVGVLIQSRELLEQVSDVGPDAEIVQLADVNPDAHVLIILIGAE
jgi:hypothetical protein